MNIDFVNKYGYSELYELENVNDRKYGRFVTFSKNNPDKIIPISNKVVTSNVLGVTTINFSSVSDNYLEWKNKYEKNEFGDVYFKKQEIAKGKKQYNEVDDLSYMQTYKDIVYKPIINENYDISKNYSNRLSRPEWICVNILGKCIVEDNGECIPGEYCSIYDGDDEQLYGTAIPANELSSNKYYVIQRISKTTILIFFK